jgi:hypothetical protein
MLSKRVTEFEDTMDACAETADSAIYVHAHRVSLQQHSKAWVQILLLRLVSLVHIYVRGPLGSSELNARNRWL